MNMLGVFFLAGLIGLSMADNVTFEPCPDTVTSCEVQEVRLSPCPEAAAGKRCKVKRGNNVNISFDFKPNFDAVDNLENDVYWASPEGDLPWQGLERNACSHVSCPIKKNELNSFSYDVKTDKYAPPVS